MTEEERGHSKILVYQVLPSRYGMNPDDLRRADAIEVVVGQGAKPGGGGMLLGHKISDRVAAMRALPKGIDQRSACRHPDWTGRMTSRSRSTSCARSRTGRSRSSSRSAPRARTTDVQLAVKAGADVIVVDGMQGGTAATQDVFIEHVGIPTLPATRIAVDACRSWTCTGRCSWSSRAASGPAPTWRRRSPSARTQSRSGTAALISLGDNSPSTSRSTGGIGSAAGFYDDWQAGRDPAGITTQDDELSARLDPVLGGRRIANYLRVLTLEAQTLARACGKSHVHNSSPRISSP